MSKFYKNKKVRIVLIILLVTIFCASSYYLFSNLREQKKEQKEFEELENIIEVKEETTIEDITIENEEENERNNVIYYSIDLSSLKSKNDDLVAWVKIDGTNINYPVMQNGQYYLKRNFYKNYSSLGTPFLADYCNLKTSDCLTIYGHHIKSGLMFADLEKYKSFDFYNNHKYITLYTLENEETKKNIYEICFAFKTTANDNGFKYYSYNYFLDFEDYNSYINSCKHIELYNTGVETNYGDKFIQLSTCEYSQENGRMVIVARKV